MGPATQTIRAVPAAPAHRPRWEELYAGYAHFYEEDQTPEMRERVWSWLMDPAHELRGLLALSTGGEPVGLAHYRPFARPLAASTGCYLDDLFVDPGHRGSGAAPALLDALRQEARKNGWSVVRWITRDTNYRARAFYDRLARRTDWLTYEFDV